MKKEKHFFSDSVTTHNQNEKRKAKTLAKAFPLIRFRFRFAKPQTEVLCPKGDSNSHTLRHHPLKMACLPVSPSGPETWVVTRLGFEPRTLRLKV